VDPRRSKEIEGENAKQKELLAKAMLNSAMLKDSATKNWGYPSPDCRPRLTRARLACWAGWGRAA
jgi:hypothetical protein